MHVSLTCFENKTFLVFWFFSNSVRFPKVYNTIYISNISYNWNACLKLYNMKLFCYTPVRISSNTHKNHDWSDTSGTIDGHLGGWTPYNIRSTALEGNGMCRHGLQKLKELSHVSIPFIYKHSIKKLNETDHPTT